MNRARITGERIREALVGAETRKQVLERLGVTAATTNYDRLESIANDEGLELPELRPHAPQSSNVGVLEDAQRLKELVRKGLTLSEIQQELGLRSGSGRRRLRSRLSDLGLLSEDDWREGCGDSQANMGRFGLVGQPWSSDQVGDVAELRVAAALRKVGGVVSKPLGQARYDLVVDLGGLHRVQVKSSVIRKGAFVAKRRSSHGVYTSADIDVVVVAIAETNALYWIPLSDFGESPTLLLRTEPAKNGQVERIRAARDYFIGTI